MSSSVSSSSHLMIVHEGQEWQASCAWERTKSRVHSPQSTVPVQHVVARGREIPQPVNAEPAMHYRRRGLGVLNAARGMHPTTWCSGDQSVKLLGEKVLVSCARSRYTLYSGRAQALSIGYAMTCIKKQIQVSQAIDY